MTTISSARMWQGSVPHEANNKDSIMANGTNGFDFASHAQDSKVSNGSSQNRTLQAKMDRHQRLVETPYGRGLVVRTQKAADVKVGKTTTTTLEVQLLDWSNAASSWENERQQEGSKMRGSAAVGRPFQPTLYSTQPLPSVPPEVGHDVICDYGRGTIVHISAEENRKTFQVVLTDWRLAGRSRVTCFLVQDTARDAPLPLQVVRAKALEEMTAVERVEFAQERKRQATQKFSAKDYRNALELYAGAVDAVRYVQHDVFSPNEVRADLVEVMVTCSNNAATCCIQLSRWTEAARFAQNALVLLDTLFAKRGLKIHTLLVQDKGLMDEKLFGEWRVKSHLVMARSHMERLEYDEATTLLKKAHEIIAAFTTTNATASTTMGDEKARKASLAHLALQDKEVRKLHSRCLDKRKLALRKEKLAAKAMFAKEEDEAGEEKKKEDDGKVAVKNNARQTTDWKAKATERTLDTQTPQDGEPWYVRHAPALSLVGVGLAAVVAAGIFRRSKSAR